MTLFARAATVVLVVALAYAVGAMALAPSWGILAGLVLGWILADLGSGLVHMLMDYVALPARLEMDRLYFATRRGGRDYDRMRRDIMRRAGGFWRISYDFKVHHPSPDTLGRRSLAKLVSDTLPYGALPLALLLDLTIVTLSPPAWMIAAGVSLIVGGVFVQYFHACLHRTDPPAVIVALRRIRLLMSPAAHDVHHDTLDRDFAIVSGWTNPLLNPLFGVLRRLGICREENLEPPRTAATIDAPTPDPRPGLARRTDAPGAS